MPHRLVYVRLGAVASARRHRPGPSWHGYVLTVALLAGATAGCSSQPAVTGSSVTSCYQFALGAIQRHVTVTAVPAACQKLSQIDVNVAVSRALQAAAAGVRGKSARREVIARDIPYVARLIHAIPASSQPTAAAPPGQPAVAAPPSRPLSWTALGLAALAVWLVTVALGVSMLVRWLTRTRRPGRGAVLNFTHFGLALTGLAVWISYLATGVTGLAWTACGLLIVVASLGMTLVFLGPATPAAATRPKNDPLPVGRPPVPVIAAHITGAVVTILLATLAAIGTG